MDEGAKNGRILSVKAAIAYGLGVFGLHLMVGYLNTYQSQFYTSVLGAKLTAVAVIILVAKVISAIADPLIGNLIDRSRFRSGKMRPFVLIGAFPVAILTTIIFIKIPFRTNAGMYSYVTFTTVLWNIAMSFADIPSQGMLALLSPNSGERNFAAGVSNFMKGAALAAPSLLVPIICLLAKSEKITSKEYAISAVTFALLGIALILLIYFCNKERVPSQSNRMSFKAMFAELKNNKMLMIVFLTFMLGFGRNMALGIGVQASAVLLREGVDITIGSFRYKAAGENLPWLLGLTASIGGTLSVVLAPIINQKWGEKKSFVVFSIYGAIVCSIAFVLYVVGVSALRTLWAIMVYQFFVSLMTGTHGYLPMVMVSDIVDYTEWKTGRRTEGIQFAILCLSNKISNALSVACGIFIVGLSGYFGGIAASDITNKMQNVVFAAFIFIPGICSLLSMLPVLFYKIDFGVKKAMRAELAERRAQSASSD